MAEIDRVNAAIDAEQLQVTNAVADLQAQIDGLKGQVLTPEAADALIAKVQNIYNPPTA